MRSIALGRKNYLFAGSDAGGDRAASLYTIVQTAKLNGLTRKPICATRSPGLPRVTQSVDRGTHAMGLKRVTTTGSVIFMAIIGAARADVIPICRCRLAPKRYPGDCTGRSEEDFWGLCAAGSRFRRR